MLFCIFQGEICPGHQGGGQTGTLRRLDRAATKPGTAAAIAVGMISTLIMGIGMCCTMVWSDTLFIPGIIIGVVGIVGICAAYPLYQCVTKRRRDKLAPEILRLTEELIR